MNKFITILLIFTFLALPNLCFGFQKNSIILNTVPENTYYAGTYDNLVLDFNFIALKPDTLQAISLKNTGQSSYTVQIKDMYLWQDKGKTGFQGIGIDQNLGKFNYSESFGTWAIEGLDVQIWDMSRFFVTVDTFYEIPEPGTIKMQIPVFFDLNTNNKYDLGDKGVFMQSGDNGPIDMAAENNDYQKFSNNNFDSFAPQINISNLKNGSIINNNNFVIKGFVRDQGNNNINNLMININDQEYKINDYNPQDHSWSYNWSNIIDGQYSVQVEAEDDFGNQGQTDWLTVYAQKYNFSYANSAVSLDKTEITNSGLDKITGQIMIKDQVNKPIIGQPAEIISSPGLTITKLNQLTDDDGVINFEIRAVSFGSKSLVIKFSGQIISYETINVVYNDQLTDFLQTGDLIKGTGPAVYLYGAENKRHAFPNESVFYSWYQDFSDVKIVDDMKIAKMTLSKNITYKPGNVLVKLQTDPKVYAVDHNATLRWVENENIAQQIFGQNWGKMINVVDDTYFFDYKIGKSIAKITDYDPLMALVNAEIFTMAVMTDNQRPTTNH